jgi:VCBS repeat protein
LDSAPPQRDETNSSSPRDGARARRRPPIPGRQPARIAALLVGLCLVSAAVAFGDTQPASQRAAIPDPTLAPPEVVQQDAAQAARQAAYRNSAAGRDERSLSQQAFRNQSDAQAERTDHSHFAAWLESPALQWPALASGEQLRGYLNDRTAVIREPSGHGSVVESSLPLRGKSPSGKTGPVDLALVDAGGSAYAPKSTAVPIRIPKNSGDALRFPNQSFGISLAGAHSQPAALSSNNALYANVLPDADLVLGPQPTGAELSIVLRSPAAPASIPLRFDLSGGQKLELVTGDGSDLPQGSAELVDGGKRVAAIPPAAAADAQGRSVPVSYRLDGDQLVIQVDTSADLAYPILVDPPIGVYDSNGTSAGAGTPGYTWPNWTPTVSSNATFSYCNNQPSNPNKPFYFCQGSLTGTSFDGGPLFIKGNTTYSYAGTEWGEWFKPAHADPDGNKYIYITQFHAASVGHQPNHSMFYVGIFSAVTFNWENPGWVEDQTGKHVNTTSEAYYQSSTATPNTYYAKAGTTAQPDDNIAPGNVPVFGLSIISPGTTGTPLPYMSVSGGATISSEKYAPTLDAPTHTTAPPSGWVQSYSDTMGVTAQDHGFGMGSINASGPGLSASTQACSQNGGPTGEQNLYDSPCTLTLTMANKSYTAPEGINTYTASATDLVGNHDSTHDQTWQVKVDNSAPTMQLSGPLWDARGTTLADGQYNLHVSANDGATDGNPADARSGVQSIEISVDGEQQDFVDQDCAAGSCSMSRDWTFDTSAYSGGQHTVEVDVIDQVGNITSQTFTFNRACCLLAAAIWDAHAAGTTDVAYGDVNGDGAADVVTRDRLTGDVEVQTSNSSGLDAATSWGSWSPLYDLHVADVNGDGNADLVGWNPVTGDVQVALSDGQSSFGAQTSWGTWPTTRSIAFADIDGDGAADVVGRDPITGDVSVAYSDGSSSFEPLLSIGTWPSNYSLSFVDVDGDGRADAVGRDSSTGRVQVALQDDSGLLPATAWGTLGGNYDVTYGDVNGDTLADVVGRNHQTGDVQVLQSDGSRFGTPTSWGSWAPSNALQTADTSGDGTADLVGSDSLGNISTAISVAPAPDSPPADNFTADEAPTDAPADVAPPDTSASVSCPVSSTQTAGKHHGMYIAFEDDARLLERTGLVPAGEQPFDGGTGEHDAQCAINHLYDRMRQAGASVVRFDVWWGWTQNNDGSYYWTKLDKAVDLARANGFQVELTLTGASVSRVDCSQGYNPNGRGCNAPTGVNPSPSAYRQFVHDVVQHFTHPTVRAQFFSLWNEPNGKAFLAGTDTQQYNGYVPADLYGQLYAAGYLGYRDGLAGVGGTRVLMGELSSDSRSGRGAGKSCDTVMRGARKCIYSAMDFLKRAVPAASTYLGGGQVHADGVALHPYQHSAKPSSQGHDQYHVGIGRLKPAGTAIGDLCGTMSGNQCQGQLARQDGGRPELYLTEFGCFNRPFLTNGPSTYHRETQRRAWFAGGSANGGQKGAMRQALDHHAAMMLLYTLTELPPQLQPSGKYDTKWDSGLIGPPDSTPPDNDINGCRAYGKRRDGRGWSGHSTCPPDPTDPHSGAQNRLAYCGIRHWAASWDFIDPKSAPYANGCSI